MSDSLLSPEWYRGALAHYHELLAGPNPPVEDERSWLERERRRTLEEDTARAMAEFYGPASKNWADSRRLDAARSLPANDAAAARKAAEDTAQRVANEKKQASLAAAAAAQARRGAWAPAAAATVAPADAPAKISRSIQYGNGRLRLPDPRYLFRQGSKKYDKLDKIIDQVRDYLKCKVKRQTIEDWELVRVCELVCEPSVRECLKFMAHRRQNILARQFPGIVYNPGWIYQPPHPDPERDDKATARWIKAEDAKSPCDHSRKTTRRLQPMIATPRKLPPHRLADRTYGGLYDYVEIAWDHLIQKADGLGVRNRTPDLGYWARDVVLVAKQAYYLYGKAFVDQRHKAGIPRPGANGGIPLQYLPVPAAAAAAAAVAGPPQDAQPEAEEKKAVRLSDPLESTYGGVGTATAVGKTRERPAVKQDPEKRIRAVAELRRRWVVYAALWEAANEDGYAKELSEKQRIRIRVRAIVKLQSEDASMKPDDLRKRDLARVAEMLAAGLDLDPEYIKKMSDSELTSVMSRIVDAKPIAPPAKS